MVAKPRIPSHQRPPRGTKKVKKSPDMALMTSVRRNRWPGMRGRGAPFQLLAIALVFLVVLLATKELHGRPLEDAEVDKAKDVTMAPKIRVGSTEINPPTTPPSTPPAPTTADIPSGPPDPSTYVVLDNTNIENVVRSSPEDQPLIRLFPGYMPPDVFAHTREGLLKTTDKKDDSLFKANFGYTSGWMVRFNAEGVDQFKSDPKFEFSVPFFEQALNPDANAFVMNLLICYEPAEGANAVEYHVDNSVGIKNSIAVDYTVVAHQVNVLYVDIPEGLEGGALEVWPYENQTSELGKAIVSPAENLMAEFRGDAFHRVGPMKLKGGKPRVGLVFEQYKITPEFYPYTTKFCLGDECAKIQDDAGLLD